MTPGGSWTWRNRLQDPRFPALLVLGAAAAALASVVWGFELMAFVFVLLVAAGLGLTCLPPWRDPKHGPAAGAAVLLLGAAALSAAAVIAR